MTPLPCVHLTPARRKLLQMIAEEGLSYKEIAYRQGRSYYGVKASGQALCALLGCHTALELAVRYWQRKHGQTCDTNKNRKVI